MKNIKFKIYQLKDFTDYIFFSYDYAEKHNFKFEDYELIYEDDIKACNNESIETVLNNIFTRFNIDLPHDYTGHSLSVSDIVEIENEGLFYVDPIGFSKINL